MSEVVGQNGLKHTPLHRIHQEAGARLAPFAGYEMPIQYKGGLVEHRAVRQSAGLFDVSHMGRVHLTGPEAVAFADYLTTNSVPSLEIGQAQYSTMCNPDGGTLDDILVYRQPDSILFVVNASNRQKDLDWLQQHQPGFNVQIEDVTEATGLIALQGPDAQAILSKLTKIPLDKIQYYHFTQGLVEGMLAIVSRTGYTGEDGFELMVKAEKAAKIWSRLMEAGQDFNIELCGLGARNTLRLDMGYPLYGNELDKQTTPLEAGLGRVVKLNKPDFIGKDALIAQKTEGIPRRLVGIQVTERAPVPRQHFPILMDGRQVGTIASGTISPSLGYGIATAFMPRDTKMDQEVSVEIRGTQYSAQVTKPPFYKEGSHR